MKILIYLIVIVLLLRWLSQAFKVQHTVININNPSPNQARKPEGSSSISGSVETKTSSKDLGNYVDYEEVKD